LRGDFLDYQEHLEFEISRLCIETGSTIALAESCTGGMISSRITDVPGSSQYFPGGFVVYSNEAKVKFLGVPAEEIRKSGAVSASTALFMADGIRRALGSDLGLAVTGIAGPGGGSEEKPVGLVFFGVSDAGGSQAHRFIFTGDRAEIRNKATQEALFLLKQSLEKKKMQIG
jgi:nicotinamide-nucleotide amidase